MPDVFKLMKNALLDLQQADYNSFRKPLKTLGRLVDAPELATINASLTANVDFTAFAESGAGTGRMGGEQLVWPDDPIQHLGLTIVLIRRLAADPDEAIQFCLRFYSGSRAIVSGLHELTKQVLVPFMRDYEAYVRSRGETELTVERPGSNEVFIVHGHDDGALQALARFLEKLGLKAQVLNELPNEGRTIIEKFEQAASAVGFAIVLLTPDDDATADGQQRQRARQNVLFELGYFAGKLGRGRVCLLRKGDVEMPSDLFGVVYTDLDAVGGWKHALVKELKAARLEFDANRLWS